MDKYICLNCGSLFDEPKPFVERHGLDTPPYERWNGCPECGGAYTEAHGCDICGETIVMPYIKLANGDRVCSRCYINYDLGEE